MKFSKSLFLAFAGLGLFACSNEDVTNGGNFGNDETKSMVISLNGVTKGSRAVESAQNGGTATLSNVAIYYTDDNGNVGHVTTLSDEDENWGDLTGDGYVEHNLPAAITQVHVVGNYDVLGDPNDYGTISGVKTKAIDAAEQQAFSEVLLWGADTNGLEKVATDGTHTENVVKAELTIAPLVSRLEISNIQCEDLGNQYSSIDLKKIGLSNFYTTITIEGTEGGLTKIAGADSWTTPTWSFDAITGATLSDLNTIYNPEESKVFAYNIIPNELETPTPLEVRLLVDAKRGETTDPFNNTLVAKVNQDLEAGKIYKMTYKFTEDNIGPWNPENTQCVIVDVTVANWVVETLTPSFE